MKPIEELEAALRDRTSPISHEECVAVAGELVRLRGAEERMRERAAKAAETRAGTCINEECGHISCAVGRRTSAAIRALPLTTEVTTETKENGR